MFLDHHIRVIFWKIMWHSSLEQWCWKFSLHHNYTYIFK